MLKRPKIKITVRAVIQRINRKLKPDLQQLRTTRGERLQNEFGQYHVIDFQKNYIVDSFVDPEAMARDLEVLADFEEVVEEQ